MRVHPPAAAPIQAGGYNMKKKNTKAGISARSASVRHSSVAMKETMS
jgi:hypothetical protein